MENKRRIRSKLPSANLQVTCATASCLLAPQSPSQLHNNRSLINKHCRPFRVTFTLRYDRKLPGLIREVDIQAYCLILPFREAPREVLRFTYF